MKFAGRPSGAGLKARSRLQHPKSGGTTGVGRDDLSVWPSWLDEPASTHASHLIEREPLGCGSLGNASGRAETAVMEGRRQRLERRDAAGGRGGKELEAAEAHIEPPHDISRSGDTRQERNFGCNGRLSERLSEARRDDELRTGLHARLKVALVHNGAGANDRAIHLGHLSYDLDRNGRTQRDFKRAQAPDYYRLGDWPRIGSIPDHEHRNDRCQV